MKVSKEEAINVISSVASSLGYVIIPDLEVYDLNDCSENLETDLETVDTKKVDVILPKHKEKIIKMFKKGKTVNEVMESFSYTKQQLAAIKAWVTMGKY